MIYGNMLARIVTQLERSRVCDLWDAGTPIADEVQSMADTMDDLRSECESLSDELDGIREQCVGALQGVVGAETHRGTPNLVWQLCLALAEATEVPAIPETDELMAGWTSDLD
jgi:hypothetical protein